MRGQQSVVGHSKNFKTAWTLTNTNGPTHAFHNPGSQATTTAFHRERGGMEYVEEERVASPLQNDAVNLPKPAWKDPRLHHTPSPPHKSVSRGGLGGGRRGMHESAGTQRRERGDGKGVKDRESLLEDIQSLKRELNEASHVATTLQHENLRQSKTIRELKKQHEDLVSAMVASAARERYAKLAGKDDVVQDVELDILNDKLETEEASASAVEDDAHAQAALYVAELQRLQHLIKQFRENQESGRAEKLLLGALHAKVADLEAANRELREWNQAQLLAHDITTKELVQQSGELRQEREKGQRVATLEVENARLSDLLSSERQARSTLLLKMKEQVAELEETQRLLSHARERMMEYEMDAKKERTSATACRARVEEVELELQRCRSETDVERGRLRDSTLRQMESERAVMEAERKRQVQRAKEQEEGHCQERKRERERHRHELEAAKREGEESGYQRGWADGRAEMDRIQAELQRALKEIGEVTQLAAYSKQHRHFEQRKGPEDMDDKDFYALGHTFMRVVCGGGDIEELQALRMGRLTVCKDRREPLHKGRRGMGGGVETEQGFLNRQLASAVSAIERTSQLAMESLEKSFMEEDEGSEMVEDRRKEVIENLTQRAAGGVGRFVVLQGMLRQIFSKEVDDDNDDDVVGMDGGVPIFDSVLLTMIGHDQKSLLGLPNPFHGGHGGDWEQRNALMRRLVGATKAYAEVLFARANESSLRLWGAPRQEEEEMQSKGGSEEVQQLQLLVVQTERAFKIIIICVAHMLASRTAHTERECVIPRFND